MLLAIVLILPPRDPSHQESSPQFSARGRCQKKKKKKKKGTHYSGIPISHQVKSRRAHAPIDASTRDDWRFVLFARLPSSENGPHRQWALLRRTYRAEAKKGISDELAKKRSTPSAIRQLRPPFGPGRGWMADCLSPGNDLVSSVCYGQSR